MKGKIIPAAVIIAALAAVIVAALALGAKSSDDTETIVIAVPYSELVADYNSNYYTAYLEQRAGCALEFVYLEEGYERESLDLMLSSQNSRVDAVFLPQNREILPREDYLRYIERGLLAAPPDYLGEDSNLAQCAKRYDEIDFSELCADGRMYCFPSAHNSRSEQTAQVLWINADWLTRLGLALPRTAEELREVLRAFAERDPNGNGVRDELPMISCDADSPLRSCLYLINAFAYFDAGRLSLYAEDGSVRLGTEQAGFREGVAFCAELYAEGLLVGDCFSYTAKQLAELVNDPADIVGAFSCNSIADVVYTNNPDILAHFVQLAPVSSELMNRGFAVSADIIPTIGGLLPENSPHKQKAAEIMDIMLSDEAALIALYGEENVDWRFSRDGELSTYGTRAAVTTLRYIKNERQNKNYAGAGPLLVPAEYYDGVTWNGDHSMTEYIDARAAKTYESYYRAISDSDYKLLRDALSALPDKNAAADCLGGGITRFITGEWDISDDKQWEGFLLEFKRTMNM